ncbi:MAG: response regulator [Cyanobacteria bacterium P01_H01_bin.21]
MPKVLLVENNALTRKMLHRRLQHSDYEVILAADGDKGVSIAIEQQPELIIMATDLPVMDGWQAIKILKASAATAHIPVIALTADTKSGNWKTALEAGCNDYDTKPVVLKRILGKIDKLLGKAVPAPTDLDSLEFTASESVLPTFSMSELETAFPISAHDDTSSKALLNARYEVGRVLNSSPFGQCLLAKDLKSSPAKSVVVNSFNLPVDNSALLTSVRERLTAEMSFLSVITRQGDIATCLDSFEQDNTFYWVQAHVVGTLLADELGSAQSMGHVLQLTHSLLTTVHPFHQGQMVHCVCHPTSFMRRQSDNRIVLVEYGVLRRLFVSLRSHSLDYRQALLQHQDYQPAEQRVGNPQLNSDIYAIGMIVLQSLTGQSPEWLVTAGRQRSLTELVKADAKIVKLFERMISPNPQLRFGSASEALTALPLGLIPKKNKYRQALSS